MPAVEAEVVNTETGEVALMKMEPELPAFVGYTGASTLAVTKDEAEALAVELPAEQHDILPTGEVYVSQVQYRRLLNKVFGPGQWSLIPHGEFIKQGRTLCREYALVVRGHFISAAVGEADYHDNNERSSWATAAEALKSNALTRCCKDLGIASECWDKRWAEGWKAQHAVQVWRESEKRPQWRRKDAAPWHDEKGTVQDRRPAPAQNRPAPAPAQKAEPVTDSKLPPMHDTGSVSKETGQPILSPFPGPWLGKAEMAHLFDVARREGGVKSKDGVYPIASKALGVTITSTRQIPIARLDDVMRALTGEPEPAEEGR